MISLHYSIVLVKLDFIRRGRAKLLLKGLMPFEMWAGMSWISVTIVSLNEVVEKVITCFAN